MITNVEIKEYHLKHHLTIVSTPQVGHHYKCRLLPTGTVMHVWHFFVGNRYFEASDVLDL